MVSYVASLGGSDIYGERDFLIWDSAMTEKDNDHLDVFNRQALMSGERIPIIMIGGDDHRSLRKTLEDAIGGWWHGNFYNPEDFLHQSDEYDDLNEIPYASQGLSCSKIWDKCNENKFSARCWIDRKDFMPELKQAEKPEGQVSWHPGW